MQMQNGSHIPSLNSITLKLLKTLFCAARCLPISKLHFFKPIFVKISISKLIDER